MNYPWNSQKRVVVSDLDVETLARLMATPNGTPANQGTVERIQCVEIPVLIQIRSELPTDHERVGAIQTAAFGRPDEADLVDALRTSARPQLSLVAEVEHELVGHVFFSPVVIEGPASAPACAGLAPVGVLPAHQHQSVASALIRSGLEQCSELGWEAVFLVGDPAFYGRFGFTLAAPHGLRYESESFDPVFQLLELRRGALRDHHGWVRYHEAFARLA